MGKLSAIMTQLRWIGKAAGRSETYEQAILRTWADLQALLLVQARMDPLQATASTNALHVRLCLRPIRPPFWKEIPLVLHVAKSTHPSLPQGLYSIRYYPGWENLSPFAEGAQHVYYALVPNQAKQNQQTVFFYVEAPTSRAPARLRIYPRHITSKSEGYQALPPARSETVEGWNASSTSLCTSEGTEVHTGDFELWRNTLQHLEQEDCGTVLLGREAEGDTQATGTQLDNEAEEGIPTQLHQLVRMSPMQPWGQLVIHADSLFVDILQALRLTYLYKLPPATVQARGAKYTAVLADLVQ